MKKLLVLAAIVAGAICASAYVELRLPYQHPVASAPLKVEAISAASTNMTATVQVRRFADVSRSYPVRTATVVTNGWTSAGVPVIGTNWTTSVATVAKSVSNVVVSASCAGGTLQTNKVFWVLGGDRVENAGTAERVSLVAE